VRGAPSEADSANGKGPGLHVSAVGSNSSAEPWRRFVFIVANFMMQATHDSSPRSVCAFAFQVSTSMRMHDPLESQTIRRSRARSGQLLVHTCTPTSQHADTEQMGVARGDVDHESHGKPTTALHGAFRGPLPPFLQVAWLFENISSPTNLHVDKGQPREGLLWVGMLETWGGGRR